MVINVNVLREFQPPQQRLPLLQPRLHRQRLQVLLLLLKLQAPHRIAGHAVLDGVIGGHLVTLSPQTVIDANVSRVFLHQTLPQRLQLPLLLLKLQALHLLHPQPRHPQVPQPSRHLLKLLLRLLLLLQRKHLLMHLRMHQLRLQRQRLLQLLLLLQHQLQRTRWRSF